MSKILNIAALGVQERRILEIEGKAHEVRQMTTEDYILNAQDSESYKGLSPIEQIKLTMKMIKRSIPSVSDAELLKQTPEKLQAIIAFIRGMEPDELMKIFDRKDSPPQEEGDQAGKQ